MDNSILASDTVVPPFTVFGGRPATFISELPETFPFLAKQKTIQYYRKFIKAKKKA
jgi:dynactin 5